MKKIRFFALALLLAGVLTGCLGNIAGYEGTVATQDERITLKEGGPHAGSWQDENLLVVYRYTLESNSFAIEGTVELTRRLTNTFTTVQNFAVRTNLLTAGGKITESLVIVSVGNSIIRKWGFSETADVAAEVSAVNFSYSGRASEPAGGLGGIKRDNGVSTRFWKKP